MLIHCAAAISVGCFGGSFAGIYNCHKYTGEMRIALYKWATYLTSR